MGNTSHFEISYKILLGETEIEIQVSTVHFPIKDSSALFALNKRGVSKIGIQMIE